MSWIERIFYVSPDGGNEIAEVMVVEVIALVVLVALRKVVPWLKNR